MWQTLSCRIASVQNNAKGSAECRNAVRESKFYLKDIMLPQLLHLLRSRVLGSPGMKKSVFRATKHLSGDRGYDHRLRFRKERLSSLLRDRLVWVLFQLVTEDVGLKDLDTVTAIIELRRLVENGNVSIVSISSSDYKIIADLAL